MKKSRFNVPPLALLFTSNLAILFVGMGLFPILPYYAARFGASPAVVGLYFAIINGTLAAGSLTPGLLAQRMSANRMFIVSGVLGMLSLFLLAAANQLWQVILLTALVWYFGGLNLGLINIFLGILTPKETRGRSFSLLALNAPLGALLGGAAVGGLVAGWGYSMLFLALGFLWIILPAVGLLLPQEERQAATAAVEKPAAAYKFYRLSEPFAAVLWISLLSVVAISAGRMGLPMLMQVQAFTASQVSGAQMISGLIAIPAVLLAGSLTDRFSRSRFLIFIYLVAGAGIISLALATQLWHFWVSASLVLISFCLNGALASAVATDVLPASDLKRGLAWLNAAIPAASIVAYASTGYLTGLFGYSVYFFMVAGLPLAAAVLMEYAIQRCRRALVALDEIVIEMPIWEENAFIKRCL